MYRTELRRTVTGNKSLFLLGPMEYVDPTTSVTSHWYMDATDLHTGAGRWANDACDYDGVPDHLHTNRTTNIKFRLRIAPHVHSVYLQYYVEMYAIDDIPAGRELFVAYGEKYWQDVTKYFKGTDPMILQGVFEEELEL